MATKIFGTQGTLSEFDWANMMALTTQKYTRRAPVNATLNALSITIPPFFTVGAGVGVEETMTTTVPLPSGAISGRWYLLVLRRTWGLTPTARHEWLLDSGEGGKMPGGWPGELPTMRQKRPGIMDDEPVLWYYHHSTVSSRLMYDASNLAAGVVVTEAGLWDPVEQGFQYAVKSGGTNVDGVLEFGRHARYVANNNSWRQLRSFQPRLYEADQEFPLSLNYFQHSAVSGWEMVAAAGLRIGDQAQIIIRVRKVAVALTVPANGDITNQTVAKFYDNGLWTFGSRYEIPMSSGGSGRVAHGAIYPSGILVLGAVSPGANIAINEEIQLGTSLYPCAYSQFGRDPLGLP